MLPDSDVKLILLDIHRIKDQIEVVASQSLRLESQLNKLILLMGVLLSTNESIIKNPGSSVEKAKALLKEMHVSVS